MTELLDREEFRLWLATREPDEVVGSIADPFQCGVATYLKNALGYEYARVYYAEYQADGLTAHMPAWAQQFARAFDTSTTEYSHPISAKDALGILDSIEETA